MIASVARSRFGSWLAQEMEARRLNKSQVAKYTGVDQSAVGRWLRDEVPSLPSERSCRALAEWWKVPAEDVLALAGHYPMQTAEEQDLPRWLREALPLLKGLDDAEGKTLKTTARALLEMREEKERSEAEE